VKIIDDLWQVVGEGLTAPGDATVYLVRFGHQAALIDAGRGPGHRQLVDNVIEVSWIHQTFVLTFAIHCNYP